MLLHTEKEILEKADTEIPPHESDEDDLYVTVNFHDLGDPITYQIHYKKGYVGHGQGWQPVEIKII